MSLLNKTGTGLPTLSQGSRPFDETTHQQAPHGMFPQAVSARAQSRARRKVKKGEEEVARGRVVVARIQSPFPPLFLVS
jgi:hypothetical protein